MDPHEFSHGPGRSDSQEGRPEDPQPPAGAEDASAEPIMSRLPKSRPKRQSPVRARAAQEVERKAEKRKAAKSPPRRAAPGPAAPAPSRPASTPARPHANGGDPAVFGPTEHAPGLPQLALDGAIEAVKLPIKVGANLTFRALDAVTKSLRGR